LDLSVCYFEFPLIEQAAILEAHEGEGGGGFVEQTEDIDSRLDLPLYG
jgi:hypothetical protein